MLTEDSISTRVEKRGEVTVLAISGDIDSQTSDAFKVAILDVLAGNPAFVVIDLLGVQFCSSVGIRILLAANEGIGDDGQFAVAAAGPGTGRIFEILGVKDLLSVHDTVEAAVGAVQVVQP